MFDRRHERVGDVINSKIQNDTSWQKNYGNLKSDPLGLGFHGKGDAKVDLNQDGGFPAIETQYQGHLPIINDSSIVQKGGRSRLGRKTNDNKDQFKMADIIEEIKSKKTNNLVEDEFKKKSEESIKGGENVKVEKQDDLENVKKPRELMKFPKMKKEIIEGEINSAQTGMQFKGFEFMETQQGLPPLQSPLLPFEVRDANLQQSNMAAKGRKETVALPRTTSDELGRKGTDPKETGKSRKLMNEDPTQWIKEEIKQMKYRRSSLFSRQSISTNIHQKSFLSEAYCMKKMHFTNNFTFSFFNIPPVYEEENEFLRSSGNRIGKRKTRPKFTKPLGKAATRVMRPAKTENKT